MSSNVSWLLTLNVKEGQLENLKKLMGEMVGFVNQNEQDTSNYEWYFSDDEDTCHIYERYNDSAAVMTHLKGFGENFAERFMDCLDATGFTVYGNPSADVKEALAAFGPAYMSLAQGFAR
jgi:quinol monooxygenase YgiN